MCVSFLHQSVSVNLSFHDSMSLCPRGHVSPFLHGVGICGSVRLACVSVFVYLSSKLCLLSLCGSLSLHLRSRSLYLDPLPVGEHPPLPELSPVRARGRVRGSGMLSAD